LLLLLDLRPHRLVLRAQADPEETKTTMANKLEATPGVGSADDVLGQRIGLAWRELRRLATMQATRDRLYGQRTDGLDLAQADTLGLLVQEGHCRMAHLANRLRVDRSTATRAVEQLVSRGLAERSTSESDARGVVVVPTRKGLECHSEIADRSHVLMRQISADFDPEEWKLLSTLLERLVAAADQAIAAPDPRGPTKPDQLVEGDHGGSGGHRARSSSQPRRSKRR
jgi:DNA-binding MarR family transcriptional regulator